MNKNLFKKEFYFKPSSYFWTFEIIFIILLVGSFIYAEETNFFNSMGESPFMPLLLLLYTFLFSLLTSINLIIFRVKKDRYIKSLRLSNKEYLSRSNLTFDIILGILITVVIFSGFFSAPFFVVLLFDLLGFYN